MSKPKCIDWSDLSDLYLNQKLSTLDIAQLKGVTKASVLDALEKTGIAKRHGAVAQVIGKLNRNYERWTDLKELYIDRKLSMYQIAKLKNVTPESVRKQLEKRGIHIRNDREAKQLRASLSGRPMGKTTSHGYTLVWSPDHPKAKRGYVREHILIWEQVHGELLPKGWIVHHLNGIKTDNRPENLIALPNKKHLRILQAKAQRIRELEAKVSLLERAMDSQQLLWWSEN